jgi:hypothetical protein
MATRWLAQPGFLWTGGPSQIFGGYESPLSALLQVSPLRVFHVKLESGTSQPVSLFVHGFEPSEIIQRK